VDGRDKPGHDEEEEMSPELALILSVGLRMAVAAAFVVAASMITERSGPAIGALVATLPVSAGMGPNPKLPPPKPTLIPTVNVAKVAGWPPGVTPTPAAGLKVTQFADGLDHPRWLLVLPNGDVLVAETDAPPKPEDSKGIKGWVMKLLMKEAGTGTPSANRITLLRDKDGDGVADDRSVLLENLYSPFGMTLVGSDLYVADSDALMRFP